MPRVDNRGANVDEWNKKTGNGSSTHDVCRACYNELLDDPHTHDDTLKPYNGDPPGEDGWGGDVAHPDYDDRSMGYTCVICGEELSEYMDGEGDGS